MSLSGQRTRARNAPRLIVSSSYANDLIRASNEFDLLQHTRLNKRELSSHYFWWGSTQQFIHLINSNTRGEEEAWENELVGNRPAAAEREEILLETPQDISALLVPGRSLLFRPLFGSWKWTEFLRPMEMNPSNKRWGQSSTGRCTPTANSPFFRQHALEFLHHFSLSLSSQFIIDADFSLYRHKSF